ncbi:MAG: peptide-methionine (S)-S-oxide reductase MsrA [bacterium]
MDKNKLQKATLGGGCFWCLEAVFEGVEGVERVVSGYSGGEVENPTYRQVCSGKTGHAEVVQVEYDPEIISYREILYIFFTIHDPTQLNRQGPDTGTQYRSVIFYHDSDQRRLAEEVLGELETKNEYEDEIVTELARLEEFYPAEENHQDYYQQNENKSYCRAVINPKLQKAKKVFSDKFNY